DLVTTWSTLDPESASEYIDQLNESKNDLGYADERARGNIAYNWATVDPIGAMEWVRKQAGDDPANAVDAYDRAVQGWCRKDSKAAAAYVAQHMDDPAAEMAAQTVTDALVDHSIDEGTT